MSEPITCAVCGQEVTELQDFLEPPTFRYVEDDRGRLMPVLSKPIRMDPETGAICWCPA